MRLRSARRVALFAFHHEIRAAVFGNERRSARSVSLCAFAMCPQRERAANCLPAAPFASQTSQAIGVSGHPGGPVNLPVSDAGLRVRRAFIVWYCCRRRFVRQASQ